MRGILRWGFWVLAAIALLGAAGILASTQSVRSLCRTSCWLNDLLFVFLGNAGGKVGLAMVWLATSVVVGFCAYRLRRVAH